MMWSRLNFTLSPKSRRGMPIGELLSTPTMWRFLMARTSTHMRSPQLRRPHTSEVSNMSFTSTPGSMACFASSLGNPEGIRVLAVALDPGLQVPPIVDTAGTGPEDTHPDALEQGDLQLLEHPEGSLPPRHRMEFGEQFASAGVVAVEREHDQPEHGTGGKAEHQQGDQERFPGHDGVEELPDHQASLPTSERNRASLRASWRIAPRPSLPSSVSL